MKQGPLTPACTPSRRNKSKGRLSCRCLYVGGVCVFVCVFVRAYCKWVDWTTKRCCWGRLLPCPRAASCVCASARVILGFLRCCTQTHTHTESFGRSEAKIVPKKNPQKQCNLFSPCSPSQPCERRSVEVVDGCFVADCFVSVYCGMCCVLCCPWRPVVISWRDFFSLSHRVDLSCSAYHFACVIITVFDTPCAPVCVALLLDACWEACWGCFFGFGSVSTRRY